MDSWWGSGAVGGGEGCGSVGGDEVGRSSLPSALDGEMDRGDNMTGAGDAEVGAGAGAVDSSSTIRSHAFEGVEAVTGSSAGGVRGNFFPRLGGLDCVGGVGGSMSAVLRLKWVERGCEGDIIEIVGSGFETVGVVLSWGLMFVSSLLW